MLSCSTFAKERWMDPKEVKHLEENLLQLVRSTVCSFEFIQIFQKWRIIGEEECVWILSVDDFYERAFRFYGYLLRRAEAKRANVVFCPRNIYEVLLEALETTGQTNALKIVQILDNCDNNLNPTLPQQSTSKEVEDDHIKMKIFETLSDAGIVLSAFSEADEPEIIPQDSILWIADLSVGDSPSEVDSKIAAMKWLLHQDPGLLNPTDTSLVCNNVHLDILKFLVDQNPDFQNEENYVTYLIFHKTFEYLKPSEMHQLIVYLRDKGFTNKLVEKYEENGETILHRGVKAMDLEKRTVKLLVDLGLSLEDRDIFGENVYHYAMLGGRSPHYVSMLLELGKELQKNDESQSVAICPAAVPRTQRVVKDVIEVSVENLDELPFYMDDTTPLVLGRFVHMDANVWAQGLDFDSGIKGEGRKQK